MSVYDTVQWAKARRAALSRDGGVCQDCGETEGLHVHHIRPVRTFDDVNDAHFLDNLVALCASCHKQWEGSDGRPSDPIAKIGVRMVANEASVDTIMNEVHDFRHEKVFDKFIIGNPTVCSACLRRVYDVEMRPLPERRKFVSWISDEEWFTNESATVDYPPRESGEQWERPANPGATSVCECGEVGDYGGYCEALEGSVSEDRMIEISNRVVSRLREEGILLNEDALFEFIRRAKSRSNLQGHNFDIMKRAVAFGLKRSSQTASAHAAGSTAAP